MLKVCAESDVASSREGALELAGERACAPGPEAPPPAPPLCSPVAAAEGDGLRAGADRDCVIGNECFSFPRDELVALMMRTLGDMGYRFVLSYASHCSAIS
jgi:hypothetical protein